MPFFTAKMDNAGEEDAAIHTFSVADHAKTLCTGLTVSAIDPHRRIFGLHLAENVPPACVAEIRKGLMQWGFQLLDDNRPTMYHGMRE